MIVSVQLLEVDSLLNSYSSCLLQKDLLTLYIHSWVNYGCSLLSKPDPQALSQQ